MDPSHRPAEALRSVSPAQLINQAKLAKVAPEELSAEALENLKKAKEELSKISELKESRAFQWFETEFIEKAYSEAKRIFHDKTTPVETLVAARVEYLTLRALKMDWLEREIAHRELLDPGSETTAYLRDRLSLL